jgi:hypothetical protein
MMAGLGVAPDTKYDRNEVFSSNLELLFGFRPGAKITIRLKAEGWWVTSQVCDRK